MNRKPVVVGNWKMNGDLSLVNTMCQSLKNSHELESIDVVLCPPDLFIAQTLAFFNGVEHLHVGAQNCYLGGSGAYTGEISSDQLAKFGCEYVIIGHSERRELFNETNELVSQKAVFACSSRLTPIICVGENAVQREQRLTFKVIGEQLEAVRNLLDVKMLSQCIIAYEPVWAIGTGISATPEQAEEVHSFIRHNFSAVDSKLGEQLKILYGGSVKPDNAAELFSQQNIDGGLIGGASLKEADFLSICKTAVARTK